RLLWLWRIRLLWLWRIRLLWLWRQSWPRFYRDFNAFIPNQLLTRFFAGVLDPSTHLGYSRFSTTLAGKSC
ncbi:MAG: hypothetical protein O3A27_02420, partial [Actinomycetota bacterium]|nr:hypothetical protein [Actinomycetota bacterium]